MSVNGKLVHEQLRSSITKVETESRKLSSRLSSSESRVGSLVAEREQSYASLARQYLPELDVESVEQTLRAVQRDVQQIFDEKQQRRTELEEEATQLLAERGRLEQQYAETTAELDRLAEQRAELEQTVNDALQRDETFRSLCEKASQSGERVQQYRRRVEEVQLEAKEKLPAFEASPLFSYLVNCDYRTPAYKKKGLRKRLDEWVAKLIAYPEQYANYQFLGSTPELMNIEVERHEAELEAVLGQIEKIEHGVAVDQGLDAVRAEGVRRGTERDDIINSLEASERAYAELSTVREELERTRGAYYEEAVDRLKNYLENQPLATLRDQARSRPGEQDDELVRDIGVIEQEIKQAKVDARAVEQQRGLSEQNVEALHRIATKFRRMDFDSARSFFERSFDAVAHLSAFLGGSMSEATLWSAMQRNQRFMRSTKRYNPVYENVSNRGGQVAGVFGRALGEMILQGVSRGMGSRPRAGRIGGAGRSGGWRKNRSVGGGGRFSSGQGF